MALSGEIGIHATLTQTPTTSSPLGDPGFPFNYFKAWAITSGVGANQADRIWRAQRTIAASATDSLDMAGTLVDVYGTTFTLARIKGLMVAASGSNTNNVNVTRSAANGLPIFLAASDALVLRPGGAFLWFAPDAVGIAVTAGTADLLDMINSAGGTSVTYDIMVIGASA